MLEREREREGEGGGRVTKDKGHYAGIPTGQPVLERETGAGGAETAAVNTQCFVSKFLFIMYLHTFSFIHLLIQAKPILRRIRE